MDKNHRDRVESKLIATEDNLWLPPLSPKNQEKLDHLRKKRTKANNERIGFSGKSVWDWLNLLGVLAIPFVVTIVGLYFTQQITQQQNTANKQQHQIDLQIAEDQQRETTLQTYLDNMSDLLLNHNLRKSKSGDEVSQVARERTLTVLRRLDADRNGIVLQFLQDAHLIGEHNAVIDLSGANLSNDDLRRVNLSGVDLSGANLSSADLSGANLSVANLNVVELSAVDAIKALIKGSQSHLRGANLRGVNLRGANLRGAYLNYANLNGANLNGANLNGANLNGANLNGANLNYADLSGATTTQEQLNEANSLQGTTMPDGSKHP